MAEFSSDEYALIRELGYDPRFASICKKIVETHGGVPRYKPKANDNEDSRKKHDDWVYRSGIDDGIEIVLKSFAYE